MKQKKIYLVLFSIIAFMLFGKVSMGQVVVVDSVIPGDFLKSEGLIKVSKNTKPYEIEILIDEKTTELKLQINAQVSSGFIAYAFYDPVGKKRDDVSIIWSEKGQNIYKTEDLPKEISGINNESKRISVRGNIFVSYENPIPGKWLIKVSPHNANGTYKIYQIRTK
ncbi:hypothetical protein ACE1ET_06110 [Saccharicrinis sp. FJH62]|uniref:hypothetical protein n=1 Tax=Saccharicrinis sp. FJH62 TaxID=3344657 RepID=UPI0035D49108